MEFSEVGFLEDFHTLHENAVLAKYGESLDLAQDVNKLAVSIFIKLDVKNDDPNGVYSIALLSRILSIFESVIILSRMGSNYTATISFRSLVEAAFKYVALANDTNFLERIASDAVAQRRKQASALLRYKERHRVSDMFVTEANIFLEQTEGTPGPLQVRQVAELAGMLDWHDVTFTFASQATHSSATSVEESIELSAEHGLPAYVDFRRSWKGMNNLLVASSDLLLFVVAKTVTRFNLNSPIEIVDLKKRAELASRVDPAE